MGEVVAGIACSHVPFMASPKQWERLPEAERTHLRGGFERARKILEDARPDVLITFADDHFDRCFYDNLPAFLVGIGEEAVGPAVAGFDIPNVRLPIASKPERRHWYVVEAVNRASIRVVEKAGFTLSGEGTWIKPWGLKLLGS